MSMIERFAGWIRPLLEVPVVRKTRRNHGLEHATIHVLSSRVKGLRMAGRSDAGGFVLLGEARTEAIEAAARDALRRMKNGEHGLAVHPNCGTNLLTTGFLTTTTALIGFAGKSRRDAWERTPLVLFAVILAIIVAQPLGGSLQKYITTEGDPGDLEIVQITSGTMRSPFGGEIAYHRVKTRST